jgi:Fic family protein
MDKKGFDKASTGRLIPTFGGRRAFLPDPLPPKWIDISPIVGLLAKATQNVGELKGIGRTIVNPMILVRPLQRREAVSSSGMEGTYTTLNDLLLLEAGTEAAGDRNETREVLNYARALEQAIADLDRLPIASRMVRDAHRTLLSGVTKHRGAKIDPGEFKRDQNWIGGSGAIESARFIPAPPSETPAAIDALMEFINRPARHEGSALIDAALAHYQFEAIHPFADGNGRVGRMLIALMLADYHVLPAPLLYLSPWLDRHKDEYIDAMFAVSKSGDWLGWLRFFLAAVAESSSETIALVENLQQLQGHYRERFQTARRSALMLKIIDLAFERPVLRVTDIAERLEVTYAGAANNVNILLKEGVAQEVLGVYPKTIRFPEIVECLRLD